jgi:hypothetical protein
VCVCVYVCYIYLLQLGFFSLAIVGELAQK